MAGNLTIDAAMATAKRLAECALRIHDVFVEDGPNEIDAAVLAAEPDGPVERLTALQAARLLCDLDDLHTRAEEIFDRLTEATA